MGISAQRMHRRIAEGLETPDPTAPRAVVSPPPAVLEEMLRKVQAERDGLVKEVAELRAELAALKPQPEDKSAVKSSPTAAKPRRDHRGRGG